MKQTKRLLIYSAVSLYLTVLAAPLPIRTYAQEAQASQPSADIIISGDPLSPPQPEAANKSRESKKPLFIYNKEANLWESEDYTWDPTTKQTALKSPTSYSYNPEIKRWDTKLSASAPKPNNYASEKPANQTSSADPMLKTSSNDGSQRSTKLLDSSELLKTKQTKQQPTPSFSSAAAHKIAVNRSHSNFLELFYDTSISNQIGSAATTGNASVLQNTSAGNATSGDAMAMANIINMLQSSWSANGLAPSIHTADIQGDYYGDIVINPAELISERPNNCNLCGNTTVNVSSSTVIDNNIDLTAISGNATISGNTSAGNATSGDAAALANIVNMINSSISSGQSFLGIINIHGNLEGDILIASDVIDQLIAANVPTAQISMCSACSNPTVDTNDTQSINNNLDLNATSGTATVNNNTKAGSAISGDASTNVTVFNLTGKTIVGRDALLVFVNVQGEWIGFITNAPEGSTAAAFGSDITESYTDDFNDTEISTNTDMKINNNINAIATTGDTEVSYNTSAGDAVSGSAVVGVNLANMTNSTFSLSGWFGILFINVLGDWFGSLGTDTPYGNKLTDDNYGQSAAAGTRIMPVIGSAINRQPSTPQIAPDRVKVFRASFEDDGNGNAVLTSATEEIPPYTPSDSPHILAGTKDSVLPTLALILIIGALYGIVVHGDSLKTLMLRSRQL